MKKQLLLFALIVFMVSLAGCKDGPIYSDPVTKINYVYLNESSSDITIHYFTPNSYDGVVDSLFVIPVNGLHIFAFKGSPGYSPPLSCDFLSSYDNYTTVSNGEKTITQRYADNDDLYVIDNYTALAEEKYVKTVLYIFYDSFFEN